jgi:trans-aconitate 2-methyltransferase
MLIDWRTLMTHEWDPKQYEKFERERIQPFFDLLQLIHPMHQPRIVDLGCGSGILTKIVHDQFQAFYTLGIDASKEMLAKAPMQSPHLTFKMDDIQTFTSDEPFDLVISNAAIQWIPDHPHLFKRLTKLLKSGGQLAIQIPANQKFPTHVVAAELAEEEPFKEALKNKKAPIHHILDMEEYAHLLDQLGFESQVIRLQLYAHFLESTGSVVEWVKGSLLTYYKSHLSSHLYEQFFKEYQRRLIERLGWAEPFFFPMKRLFLWGQLPAH